MQNDFKKFLLIEPQSSFLTRIFHTDSSRGAAQHDADKADEDFGAELYWTYRSSLNRSPTQSASGSRKPQQNWDEISGLDYSSSGRSATSGSILFIIMRRGTSVSHDFAESRVPLAARMTREGSLRCDIRVMNNQF